MIADCPQCGEKVSNLSADALCPECLKCVTFREPAERDETVAMDLANDLLPESARWYPGGGRRSPAPNKNSGERFEDCELLEPLGHGAMGTVFKARHVRLNWLVALKLIRQGRHASEDERKRFLREAEAVARLQHPHIVLLYEAGEVEGQPFFAGAGSVHPGSRSERRHPRDPAKTFRTIDQIGRAHV